MEKKKKEEEQPNVLKQLMQLANLPNVQKKDLDQQQQKAKREWCLRKLSLLFSSMFKGPGNYNSNYPGFIRDHQLKIHYTACQRYDISMLCIIE